MKKTLITLAALAASVASAATLDFNTAKNGSSVTFDGDGDIIILTGATTLKTDIVAYPTWTNTFTCGDVTVTAEPGLRLFGVHYDNGSNNSTNRVLTNATIDFGTAGSLTVTQEGGINLINQALTFNVTLGDLYVETDDASLDGTSAGAATRTLFVDTQNGMWNHETKNYTIAAVDVDGNSVTGYTVNHSSGSIGLTYNTLYKYVAPEQPGTGDNIPEPTTATLSLLALAGLAARRRRK